MIKKSSQIAWITIAFITIVMAFIVSLARLFFPLFEEYRADIEKLAQQELGRPVKVQEVIADWSGLQPRIRIKGVSVYTRDGSRVWVKLDEVQIYFRVIDSIRSWRLRPGKIDIVGADADIAFRNGSYYIGGVKVDDRHSVGRSRLLQWMLQRQKLVISKSRISWDDRRLSKQKQYFNKINLLVFVRTERYNLSGSFRLKNQKNSRFHFIGDLRGSFFELDQMKQSFYLSGRADLGNWLNQKLIANTDLSNGHVDFRLWAKGVGRIKRFFGDINVNKVRWKRKVKVVVNGRRSVKDRSFSLDKLSANFGWMRQQSGWKLNINRIHWSRLGQKWPVSNLYIDYQNDNKNNIQTLRGRVGFVRLQDISQLLMSVLPLKNTLRTTLAEINPQGDFNDIKFSIARKSDKIAQYYLHSRFKSLSLSPWEKLPGITNMRGRLATNESGGWLDLSSNKVSISLHHLMPKPLLINRLSGLIRWEKSDRRFRVYSKKLIAKSKMAKTSSSFDIKLERNKSPLINLHTNIKNGKFAQLLNNLPVKIMEPNLVRWLQGSLSGGDILEGSVKYMGKTKDFPFRSGRGVFDVKLQLEKIRMKFHPQWPAINNISAGLHFFGKSIRVVLQQGELLGLEVMPTRITIPSLGKAPVISLDGNMIGPTANVLKFLAAIPSKTGKSTVFNHFKASGRSVMHLNLSLPLNDTTKNRFIGRVEVINSTLTHKSYPILLSELNGAINYESDGKFIQLYCKNLSARYKNNPVIVEVDTKRRDKYKRFETFIRLKSRLSSNVLFADYAKYFKGILSGTTDWTVSFRIKQFADRPLKVSVRLDSLLKGIKIKLPQWFGKIKQIERRLMVEAEITGERLGNVQVDYGGFVNMMLRFKRKKDGHYVERGQLRFGGKKAELPGRSGIELKGELSSFSVSRWQKWVAGRRTLNKSTGSLLKTISKIDLHLEELELIGNRIHQVRIIGQRQLTVWTASIDGNEVKGKVSVPLLTNDNAPLVVQLSVLKLIETDEDHKSEVPDPREMPPLRIISDEFYYNGIYHGRLNIAASRVKGGLRFDAVNMNSKYASVTSTGIWKLQHGKQLSKFKIFVSSSNLGKALRRRKYGVNMDKGKAQVVVNAHWQGPPSWFRLKHVQGDLNIEITKGRILDIEPGGGKMFGMLSMSALPRRLSLDFSDIFKKGFSFDKINGKFTISNGDAYTNNLKLQSPAVTVEVNGRLGLANQDYDQTIYIRPKITSTLPLVGGLAGGPGVGVGLWFADKIFGKKLNPVTKYTVAGTWDKPIIKKIKTPIKKKNNYDSDTIDE